MGSRQPFVAAKHKEAAEDEGRAMGATGTTRTRDKLSGIRATEFHHGNSPENCMDKHRWFEEHDFVSWGKLPNRYMLGSYVCREGLGRS